MHHDNMRDVRIHHPISRFLKPHYASGFVVKFVSLVGHHHKKYHSVITVMSFDVIQYHSHRIPEQTILHLISAHIN